VVTSGAGCSVCGSGVSIFEVSVLTPIPEAQR
jgi:hypothetical protein